MCFLVVIVQYNAQTLFELKYRLFKHADAVMHRTEAKALRAATPITQRTFHTLASDAGVGAAAVVIEPAHAPRLGALCMSTLL